MARKPFQLACNYVLLPEFKEHSEGVSLTVPDETYTIREILERFSRNGGRVDATLTRQASYDSGADFDSPDLEKLRDEDIYDRETLARGLAAHDEERRASLKKLANPPPSDKKEKTSPTPPSNDDDGEGEEKAPVAKRRPPNPKRPEE